VATLMVTMPGLPMFGHGQIEGLAEKYGMEFRRPRWAEQPSEGLIRRHARQVFPLARRRGAFAEVDRFRLYDLMTGDGEVDENVFAYSNGTGDHRSLVVYHNVFGETGGWIRTSCPVQSNPGGDGSKIERTELADALELPGGEDEFVILGDAAAGVEYLRSCRAIREQGLHLELRAYSLHVFCNLRVVKDADGRYGRLAEELEGRGVPSVDQALAEFELAVVLGPFREMVAPELLLGLIGGSGEPESGAAAADSSDRVRRARGALLSAISGHVGEDRDGEVTSGTNLSLDPALAVHEHSLVKPFIDDDSDVSRRWRLAAVAWALISGLDEGMETPAEGRAPVIDWMDDWYLARNLWRSVLRLGLDEISADRVVAAVRTMLLSEGWWRGEDDERPDLRRLLDSLLEDPAFVSYLGVNRHQDVVWFVSEFFDDFLTCLAVTAVVGENDPDQLEAAAQLLEELKEAKDASGYRVDRLLAALGSPKSKV